MSKLNDLVQDKDISVDQSKTFPITQARPLFKHIKSTTIDIAFLLLKYIDLSKEREIRVMKNKTKGFDTLTSNRKNEIDLNRRRNILSSIRFDSQYFKTLPGKFSFIGIFIILFLFGYILVSKNFIEARVNSGFGKIVSLKESSKTFEEIEGKISDARFDFVVAHFLFFPYRIIFTQEVQNGKHIISAGKNISDTLLDFISIYNDSQKLIKEKGLSNVMYSQLILNLSPYFTEAEENILRTIEHLEKIKGLENSEIQNKISEQLSVMKSIHGIIESINSDMPSFLSLLGHNTEKKYLVIFQNADEIRPTGGFMGSMGILKIFRGQVKSFESKDVYAYEWNLKKSDHQRMPAPEGINKITDTFGLRDANYFINIDESAKNIRYFIEKSGYEIDGILFVNQNVLLDMLDIAGGLKFKKIDETITSQNFSHILSLLVEAKKFKEGTIGTPKQILFDFMKEFYEKVKSSQDYGSYAKIIIDSIKKREVIFYSFNKEENDFLGKLHLNGKLSLDETLDFNYPVFTSISGNKSDRYIQREFQKVVKQNSNCSIDTSLKIIQKHTFNKSDENILNAYMKKYGISDIKKSLFIQGKGKNYQYIRILLPKAAIIKENKDITVIEYEKSKSVNFYLETDPKQVKDFQIVYSIPNVECIPYSYSLIKQPGIRDYSIFLYDGNKAWQSLQTKENFYYHSKNYE